MTVELFEITNPRLKAAVDELQGLILSHFPSTTFTVGEYECPDSVYMRAIVDVDDTDEVTEVFIDRLVDLQVDDGLSIYVVPVRTPERIAAHWREQDARSRTAFLAPNP